MRKLPQKNKILDERKRHLVVLTNSRHRKAKEYRRTKGDRNVRYGAYGALTHPLYSK